MKIISKIRIHPITYIITFIFFLMGYFNKYIIFMTIIIVHELGHIMVSLLFKWKIEKIIILPLGCLIKYQEQINKPLKEEFIISIMGIIFQILFTYKISPLYNNIIIIFNLIPIYPLDGSKILNIILNKITNFRLSYNITIYTSFIFLIILLIILLLKKDIISILILVPLLINIYKTNHNKYNYINKFYLERYLYKIKFRKIKIIKNINKMKRDYTHIVNINNKYIKEEVFLRNMFDK